MNLGAVMVQSLSTELLLVTVLHLAKQKSGCAILQVACLVSRMVAPRG
jgi:hypothetical protein